MRYQFTILIVLLLGFPMLLENTPNLFADSLVIENLSTPDISILPMSTTSIITPPVIDKGPITFGFIIVLGGIVGLLIVISLKQIRKELNHQGKTSVFP